VIVTFHVRSTTASSEAYVGQSHSRSFIKTHTTSSHSTFISILHQQDLNHKSVAFKAQLSNGTQQSYVAQSPRAAIPNTQQSCHQLPSDIRSS
jgi:hypothetical protein